jgi:hypothetical protein
VNAIPWELPATATRNHAENVIFKFCVGLGGVRAYRELRRAEPANLRVLRRGGTTSAAEHVMSDMLGEPKVVPKPKLSRQTTRSREPTLSIAKVLAVSPCLLLITTSQRIAFGLIRTDPHRSTALGHGDGASHHRLLLPRGAPPPPRLSQSLRAAAVPFRVCSPPAGGTN